MKIQLVTPYRVSHWQRYRVALQCVPTVTCAVKADSQVTCRAHAVPLRVQNVSFPFDLHSAAVSDSHLPCHAHAMLRQYHSSQGHGTAWPSRKSLWTKCLRSASSGYHAEFHEVVIRRIPFSDAGGQCETKHLLPMILVRNQIIYMLSGETGKIHTWWNKELIRTQGKRIFLCGENNSNEMQQLRFILRKCFYSTCFG